MNGLIDLSPGAVFAGDYRVVRPLAKGGMGAVYVVEQIATGRERALKLMHPMLVSDPRARARFEREARVGSVIESDHVVEVIAAGIEPVSGTPWLCMELLKGETVADRLARGPLEPGEVLEVLRQLAHALSAAHRAGIVHRDLKPENVFLAVSRREGVPFTLKVLDFGVAALVKEQQAAKTTQGVGSPMWMAPEQTDAGRVSRATDVWALGLIAFQLLTGRIYWKAAQQENATITALLVEIMVEPLAPASQRAAELGVANRLPPGFDAWFERCVARDPAARFEDAAAALGALIDLLAGRPSTRPGSYVPAAFEATRAATTGPLPGRAPPAAPGPGASLPATNLGPPSMPAAPAPKKRRTWLWVLGGIAATVTLGCGAITWTMVRGALAIGEVIAEQAPSGTVRVGPDGVALRDLDGTEVHIDGRGLHVVVRDAGIALAAAPMQPLPPTTPTPGSDSDSAADSGSVSDPASDSATTSDSSSPPAADSNPAPASSRRARPRPSRLAPHQAAFVHSVVRVCWEGNPPSAPVAPTPVRFELDLGQFGQVTRLRMEGVPPQAAAFRRCTTMRGAEYRFQPMPEENPVRFTYSIGS